VVPTHWHIARTLVLNRRRYISTALAESMAADLNTSTNHNGPLHSTLSTREFQIFCKLASGMSVSDIAKELSLSVKTISTYRGRVLEKMGFKSNADITNCALANGLISRLARRESFYSPTISRLHQSSASEATSKVCQQLAHSQTSVLRLEGYPCRLNSHKECTDSISRYDKH
jgi:DNA-binding CsgD family transcriptional regulator